MLRTVIGAGLLAGATALTAPQMAGAAQFSDLLVFGDSYSDVNNLRMRALNLPVPPGPQDFPDPQIYNEGRFTNDLVWFEYLPEMLIDQSTVRNFAYGGARALFGDGVPFDEGGDLVDDLSDQIDAALPGIPTLGSNPLAAVFIGGNDIGAAAFTASRSNPTDLEAGLATAAVLGSAVAAEIADQVGRLVAAGISNVLLFSYGEDPVAPRFRIPTLLAIDTLGDDDPSNDRSTTPYAQAASVTLQAGLEALAESLRQAGVDVTEINAGDVIAALTATPEAFGLLAGPDGTAAIAPCGTVVGIDPLFGVEAYDFTLNPNCDTTDPASVAQNLWFDSIHPTAIGHQQLAAAVVAAVPLPAPILLLGGALLVLAGLRRRG